MQRARILSLLGLALPLWCCFGCALMVTAFHFSARPLEKRPSKIFSRWSKISKTKPGTTRRSSPFAATLGTPKSSTATTVRWANPQPGQRSENVRAKTVVVAGATGYIGKAVVREAALRGYDTVALVRDAAKIYTVDEGGTRRLLSSYAPFLERAKIVECDVESPDALSDLFHELSKNGNNVDIVVSCLAARSGTKDEACRIDYQATSNLLDAGRNSGARHFVLLSAYCVRRPKLELQRAKLRFEAELASQSDMTYSIVRPTAFFKSVSGQLENIQSGAPYVLFGDGAVTRCNPISQEDLACFMMDSAIDTQKTNKILNVGGPDAPLTNQMLGEMMYKAIGKHPKFVYAPVWIFDSTIAILQFLATITKSKQLEDATEIGRIGKYYAVEDMLTTDPQEKFGTKTMQQHYNEIAAKGQDPFAPIRATAVIATFLQLAPILAISTIPVGFAFASTQSPPIQGASLFRHISSSVLASLGHL